MRTITTMGIIRIRFYIFSDRSILNIPNEYSPNRLYNHNCPHRPAMNTFYVNSSTQESTIAIFAGNTVLAEKRWPAEQNESEKLQPEVDRLLKKNKLTADDIERLIVCVGPGGFTSTRVGVSAINAWAFARNIPVSQVSVFDLYEKPETIILISANQHEGWVKFREKDPKFLIKEAFVWPKNFKFTGIVNEVWKNFLEELGGKYISMSEQLPDISNLSFAKQIVLPWYYKDANITWSSRIHGNR